MNKDYVNILLSKKLSVTTNGDTHVTNIAEVAVHSGWGEIRTPEEQYELSDMHLTQLASGEIVRKSFMGLNQVFKLI